MPTSRPQTKWTVYLSERQIEEMERRGARSDRTHGPAGRSSVLRRRLELLSELLDSSDPRETHDLPEKYFRLALQLLPDAHELAPAAIKALDTHFAMMRSLRAKAEEAGVDPKSFLRAIQALPYAQRLFLVDYAEQHNAGGDEEPPAPASSRRRTRR